MSTSFWGRLSVGKKVTFGSLVSLIPMLVIVYTAFSFSNNSSQTSSGIIQSLLVQNYSEKINGFLNKQAVIFHEWTREDIYGMAIDFQEVGEIQEELNNQLAAAPGMDLLLVTGLDGKVLYSSDAKRFALGEALAWALPLLQKPAGHVTLLTAAFSPEKGKENSFLFSFPTHDTNGKLNGLFLAFIQWAALQQEMESLRQVLINSGFPTTSAVIMDWKAVQILNRTGDDMPGFIPIASSLPDAQWFGGENDFTVREINDTFISFARLAQGKFFSVEAPIETPAHLLLVAYIPHQDIHNKVQQMLLRSIAIAIAGFVLILMTALVISKTLTNPIVGILDVILAISAGDLKKHRCVSNEFGDEIARIGNGINQMADNLAVSHDALEAVNRASERFVPLEYLKLLDKKSIVDVQLGDHCQLNMSVLFSDIRSFTTLSENMTPRQTFLFVNSYLKNMGPIIREHNGFIDKYIGDAIMALFSSSADDAVLSAIGMLRHLEIYNEGRQAAGYAPIKIGIGLHTGDLTLGTIGEDFRMEGTVISDVVNLAARIEGMTKMYGAALLISEHTFSNLVTPIPYSIRMLDRVRVVGKSEPATIFEVLDGASNNVVLQKKIATKDQFAEALTLYDQKQFKEVVSIMENILVQCPEDKAAEIYKERCGRFLQEGVDEQWEGVVTLHTK